MHYLPSSQRKFPCSKVWNHPGMWVNSLIWLQAIWGWFPLSTMIPVRSQWGRYNLPRQVWNQLSRITGGSANSSPRIHRSPSPALEMAGSRCLNWLGLKGQELLKSHGSFLCCFGLCDFDSAFIWRGVFIQAQWKLTMGSLDGLRAKKHVWKPSKLPSKNQTWPFKVLGGKVEAVWIHCAKLWSVEMNS